MAKKFIHFDIKKGTKYASVYTPQRVDGIKVNDPEYLGKVIDKELGIYKNRKQGMFRYSIENGYSDNVPLEFQFLGNHIEEKLILDFGDIHCFYEVLSTLGYRELFGSLIPDMQDTLLSLVSYKLLSGNASSYAQDWWEGSYARILFPQARLQSQRISEFKKLIGDEGIVRDFFKKYLSMLYGNTLGHSILLDSTGLPNDICFPLTACNTHNGVSSNEVRLILVVDRNTGMPLFFRYNAGNIVDVTTLNATLLELKEYGVNVDLAIVDAGYYSEKNILELYTKQISFLTRLIPNRKLYKELINAHADDLMNSRYMLFYRDRLLYIKRVDVDLFGYEGYAYIAVDHQRKSEETYQFAKAMLEDKDMTREEIDTQLRTKGMFILLSSEKVEPTEILPLYYMRQSVEQVFDISKNNADLLPLRVHGEEAFRGHLMLTFMTSVAYLAINKLLKDTKYNAEGAFYILRNLIV